MSAHHTQPYPLAEIMQQSPGFHGVFTEAGSEGTQSIQAHMLFGLANQLEGVGSDASGEFTLSGNYTDDEIFFVIKLKSSRSQQSRTFAGKRKKDDMSISGRWWVSEGGSPSGEFMLSYEDAERRFAPSYDVERLKLYYVLERLATGGFGIVSRVRRAVDGKVLVWKELNYARMNKKERRMMITEVNILRDIDHNHVVKYYDTIIVREQQKIYLIIEHCAKGDVGALIDAHKKKKRRMDEPFIWRMLGQILLALQSCHNREEIILHRDLKPANILLDDDLVVKVADFGLAAVVNSDSLACSKVGTPLYMAPEQIQGAGYTEKSDMWALGCIIYEMAALKPPFDANNQIELAGCIREGRFARIPDDYSSDLHRVICWMLQLSQDNRPSVEEMLKYIQRVELVKTSMPPEGGGSGGGSEGGIDMVGITNGGSISAQGGRHVKEQPKVSVENEKEGLGLRLMQNSEGAWRVEGIKEDSPAHRTGVLLPGDQIKTIQGRKFKGHSWDSLGPFLNQEVAAAVENKTEIVIVVLRRSISSGDQELRVQLSMDGRNSTSSTVRTPAGRPGHFGAGGGSSEGVKGLFLSPRGGAGESGGTPRVPQLPLSKVAGNEAFRTGGFLSPVRSTWSPADAKKGFNPEVPGV